MNPAENFRLLCVIGVVLMGVGITIAVMSTGLRTAAGIGVLFGVLFALLGLAIVGWAFFGRLQGIAA